MTIMALPRHDTTVPEHAKEYIRWRAKHGFKLDLEQSVEAILSIWASYGDERASLTLEDIALCLYLDGKTERLLCATEVQRICEKAIVKAKDQVLKWAVNTPRRKR